MATHLEVARVQVIHEVSGQVHPGMEMMLVLATFSLTYDSI